MNYSDLFIKQIESSNSRLIKKTKEVIYPLKFAMYMYMHLSHIPKMCYTCDTS